MPATGHSLEENEKELDSLIEQVKTTQVDDQTLNRIKTNLRASLIRKLTGNGGLASELCSYYVNFGDWRRLFTELDDYNKITAEDVQRVARQYFVPKSRTVAYTITHE